MFEDLARPCKQRWIGLIALRQEPVGLKKGSN
jgi:hypothetical protein